MRGHKNGDFISLKAYEKEKGKTWTNGETKEKDFFFHKDSQEADHRVKMLADTLDTKGPVGGTL